MAEEAEVTVESVKKDIAALEQATVEEVVETPEPTEDEISASSKGWVAEEEWVEQGKDAKAWKDAGEFLRSGDLYDKLHKQNRHIRQLQKQLGMIAEQLTKTSEVEWNKAYESLKKQFALAVKDGETEDVLELQDKLEQMKELKTVPEDKNAQDPDLQRTIDEWQTKNSWYGDDADKTDYANGIGKVLEQQHPDWSLDEVLEEVTNKVSKVFPAKKSKRSSAAVAAPRRSARAKGSPGKGLPSANQLPDEVRPVYEMLVTDGDLTHEQYMKDYMAANGPLKEV